MSDISALEARLTAALERIGAGLDGLGRDGAVRGDGDLQAQLDEERTANAQLEARVEALSARQAGRLAELERKVEDQRGQIAALDRELSSLRESNADLREVNAQLRSTAADGVASPELINRAMMAELDALQAQRQAEAAEVDAILSELKPLLKEA